MRNSIIFAGVVSLVSACGQQGSGNSPATEAATNNVAAAAPAKVAYCFFQDGETKGWKASTDKSGNVVVTGQAYREDSRYKALLEPAKLSGTSAQVSPTIAQNDTGFGAPANWWKLSETIPDSKAVSTVIVRCGDKTLATLDVHRKD